MRPLASSLDRSLSSRQPLRSVNETRTQLAKYQEQVSTGLRVNRPSDDPASYARARGLDAAAGRIEQYGRAVSAARTWVDETAVALDGLAELAARAYEMGIQGASETYGPDERERLAAQVDTLFSETVARLNTRSGGEYVFAGNRTDAAPFGPDGQPTPGDLSGARVRRVGPDSDLAVGVSGDRVQTLPDGSRAQDTFTALAAALRSGDTAGIQTALGQVSAARDHYVNVAAAHGETSSRLTEAEALLDARALAVTSRRSEAEDADLFEAISGMQRMQTQLDASLRVTAQAQGRTLLDYLR